jgi:excinuclease UvrABC nuclease subunit
MKIKELSKKMQEAAKECRFEEAAEYRDELKIYQSLAILEDHPL